MEQNTGYSKEESNQIIQDLVERFKEDGFVTNFWAIDNYILRLASIISTLRQEGWNIETRYKGVRGHKNCEYYLLKKPTRIVRRPIFNDNNTVTLVSKQEPIF